MDLGLTGKLSENYLGSVYQQNKAAGKREGVGFQDAIAARAAEKVSGQIQEILSKQNSNGSSIRGISIKCYDGRRG